MADLLIAYLESQICEYNEIGVPEPPARDTTVGTTLPPFAQLRRVVPATSSPGKLAPILISPFP